MRLLGREILNFGKLSCAKYANFCPPYVLLIFSIFQIVAQKVKLLFVLQWLTSDFCPKKFEKYCKRGGIDKQKSETVSGFLPFYGLIQGHYMTRVITLGIPRENVTTHDIQGTYLCLNKRTSQFCDDITVTKIVCRRSNSGGGGFFELTAACEMCNLSDENPSV